MRATQQAQATSRVEAAESSAECYERLRARGLRPDKRLHDAQGLVLFMREGTVSWMQAVAAQHPKAAVRAASAAGDLLSEAGAADLTEALTTMVLSATEM